jgi:hypothetical protein
MTQSHIAFPIGPSALDEHSNAMKARTTAKTYNTNKPAKFAIRLYAVTGSINPYISSFFDNRAGNKNKCLWCSGIFQHFQSPKDTL